MELLDIGDFSFLEADDVDVLLVVLSDFEFLALVEEVEQFAAVDFEECEPDLEVLVARLLYQ